MCLQEQLPGDSEVSEVAAVAGSDCFATGAHTGHATGVPVCVCLRECTSGSAGWHWLLRLMRDPHPCPAGMRRGRGRQGQPSGTRLHAMPGPVQTRHSTTSVRLRVAVCSRSVCHLFGSFCTNRLKCKGLPASTVMLAMPHAGSHQEHTGGDLGRRGRLPAASLYQAKARAPAASMSCTTACTPIQRGCV